MKLIYSGMLGTKNLFPSQKYDSGENYKLLPYTATARNQDGILFYNLMTRCMLLLSESEYGRIYREESVTKALAEKWFMVPAWLNPRSVWHFVSQRFRHGEFDFSLNEIRDIVIITTTKCNARCSYCYESGMPQVDMGETVAEDVVKFIADRHSNKFPVGLKWFGGEPLVNSAPMDIICSGLEMRGVEYSSSIITNGYLIDRFSKSTWRNLWKVSRAQVTVDGMKETYQRTKNYVNGDACAFERVISNIHYLTDFGIKTTIRLNISEDNLDEMLRLIDYISVEFGGSKSINVYSHTMFENCGNNPSAWDDETRARLYSNSIAVDKYLLKHGYGRNLKFQKPQTSHCMADSPRSVCVNPLGELTPCEHHIFDNVLGSIYCRTYNQDVAKDWQKRRPTAEKCYECFYYPQCLLLKNCPVEGECTDEDAKLNAYKIHTQMERMYQLYKRGELDGCRTRIGAGRNRVCRETDKGAFRGKERLSGNK